MTPPTNPHFATARSWAEAATLLSFEPRRLAEGAGHPLQSLSVFVRDHRHREVPVDERSLEAHYGAFSVSQCRKGEHEARRWVVEIPYGRAPRTVEVAENEGRAYELGPEPPPGDIDGRSPAVVVWCEGELFYMVASTELEAEALLTIAASMYT